MPKTAPSFGRIAAMVIFALSCFGLLLFLWLSFGGAVPLKPKGYQVKVAFPEAATLGLEADVRVAGVSVGKVRKKQLDPKGNRTLVTLELDRRFAPLSSDARAMLRQKTLLGETYVELTPGTGGSKVAEGGRLADGQVADAVQLDEIFQALDPRTRAAFREWQQEAAKGIDGRGRDLNDALGTLPGFAKDGADVLEVLDSQERALSRLVKNTGVVFGALSENEAQLRNLIVSSGRMFEATADQNDALAESIRIFPTFLDESRTTLTRLKGFSQTARPLVQDLRPVARDLGPTLRDVRALAPDLDRTFRDLDPLITVSKRHLPDLRRVLDQLRPMFGELGPFLSEVNPILDYFESNQYQVSDFLSNGSWPLIDVTASPSGGIGHYLRQLGPTGAESLAIYRDRLPSNRGNTYLKPMNLWSQPNSAGVEPWFIFPNWDCRNTESGGEQPSGDDEGNNRLGCKEAARLEFHGRITGQFPRIHRADYENHDGRGGPEKP